MYHNNNNNNNTSLVVEYFRVGGGPAHKVQSAGTELIKTERERRTDGEK